MTSTYLPPLPEAPPLAPPIVTRKRASQSDDSEIARGFRWGFGLVLGAWAASIVAAAVVGLFVLLVFLLLVGLTGVTALWPAHG